MARSSRPKSIYHGFLEATEALFHEAGKAVLQTSVATNGSLRDGKQADDQIGDQVDDQVDDRSQIGDQIDDQIGYQIGDQVGVKVDEKVDKEAGDQVGVKVGDQVDDFIGDQVGDHGQVGDQVDDFIDGQVGDKIDYQAGGQVGDQVDSTSDSSKAPAILSFSQAVLYICLAHLKGTPTSLRKIAMATGISEHTLKSGLKKLIQNPKKLIFCFVLP